MIDDNESQLWRGVVNTFAGKYLGELTVRGNSALECHQRLEGWFSRWFSHRDDVALSACQLVTKGPVVLLASGHRQPPAQGSAPRLWPVEGHIEVKTPRSVPPALRYR